MRQYEEQTKNYGAPLLRQIGYGVWVAMLLLSLVFYRQRAFFMDAGFQLFNLINEGTIQIYHHRFVTGIPQILPWLLLKAGAPLQALALSFSAGYILFYLLVYHLLVRYAKNDQLGWTLIFLFTLISLDSFYHIQSELYIGLALLLLAFGLVLKNPALNSPAAKLLLLPLLVAVAFSHKLSVIFFVFLWLFFGLSDKNLRNRRYLVLLCVFLAIAAFRATFFTNWYEAAKQVEFRGNLEHYFPNLLGIPSNLIFLKRCVQYYYLLPILLSALSVFYFLKKKWLKPGLMWSFTLGFALLYNISDPQALYRFYSEVTYLPLTIFVAVPFLFDFVPSLVSKWPHLEKRALPIAFTALMLLRLGTITLNHSTFDRQFSWITTQFHQRPGSHRLLIKSENVPMDSVLMEWGAPFSAMHITALAAPDSAKTILILPDFDWFEDKMGRKDIFFSPFHKVLEKDDLNRRYYNPPDDGYLLLE